MATMAIHYGHDYLVALSGCIRYNKAMPPANYPHFRHHKPNRQVFLKNRLLIGLLTLMLCWSVYLGVKHWQLTQRLQSPTTTIAPNALPVEQQALLSLTIDNIVALQQAKAYDKLYQQYASPQLQQSVSQAGFLHLGACLDKTIGPLISVGSQPLIIKMMAKNNFVTVTHTIIRGEVDLNETLHFTNYNGTFLLNGLYWQNNTVDLKRCIVDPLSK
jgi:hypothetical protein